VLASIPILFDHLFRIANMPSLELQPSSSRPVNQVEENLGSKADINLVESAGAGRAATYEESVAARLPKAHRDYLLERHGTLELDPIPSMGPADPYNWPEWKVSKNPSYLAGPAEG
jgi:hypothetical protein